ncbi:MAG: AAA family ATPase, partial [Lachnospiraceae bacterium]|nr:AAA family ATPase [Lachnospiraceae bacterium]
MGTYLNPGKAAFEEAVNSEIFIDKTEMLGYLNSVVKTRQKYVCVSRPRRFGKTMAADMICAYYDREADSRSLFEGRKLAQLSGWDENLGKFDVIYLVMTRFFKAGLSVSDALSNIQKLVIRDFKRKYPGIDFLDNNDLIQTLYDVYSAVGKQAVVIIDEWDAVFRALPNDKPGQTEYLDYLRDLLKDNRYISLAYMTGILPIKKYGQHSALNMFTEYSMMSPRQLAPYTGFTENEVQ